MPPPAETFPHALSERPPPHWQSLYFCIVSDRHLDALNQAQTEEKRARGMPIPSAKSYPIHSRSFAWSRFIWARFSGMSPEMYSTCSEIGPR
jgi:hypothetical protein